MHKIMTLFKYLLVMVTIAVSGFFIFDTLNPINTKAVRLLLAYEDQRFYEHYGVDPLAMTRAIGQLIRHKRVVSGGSTITMQLARLLDPKPRTNFGTLWREC